MFLPIKVHKILDLIAWPIRVGVAIAQRDIMGKHLERTFYYTETEG